MTRFRWLTALLMALVLVAAGCGGGGDDGGSASDDGGDEEATQTTEAEPEGQVLIDEDFDDDDDVWEADGLDIEGQQEATLDDGEYSVEFLSDAYETIPEGQALVPNFAWPSVISELADEVVDTQVTAEVSFAVPGSAGIACRIVDTADAPEDYRAYLFQVASSGVVNLAESDEEGQLDALEVVPELDEDEEPDELPVEGAAFDFEDDESYELGLTCVDGEDGVELTGTIDGEEVISATDDDDPIESGITAILTGQSRTATEVEGFDEFTVTYDSVTMTNLGDEIDEDDIEDAAQAAEEAEDEPAEEAEAPVEESGGGDDGSVVLNGPELGAALTTESIAEYGTNPDWDALAEGCWIADFADCDTLYLETPVGSGYEAYGATCGHRLETPINGSCEEAGEFARQPGGYPATGIAEYGSDAVFDGLADACEVGDLEACDTLYLQTPVGSGYEEFGSTCGARVSELLEGDCIAD